MLLVAVRALDVHAPAAAEVPAADDDVAAVADSKTAVQPNESENRTKHVSIDAIHQQPHVTRQNVTRQNVTRKNITRQTSHIM